MHQVIKALSDRKNPCPLVHIRGPEHVGKTRFVHEVCYYFYRHNEFRQAIMLKDLAKIETHKDFRELMDSLNRQIDGKTDTAVEAAIAETDALSSDDAERGGLVYPVLDILWAFTNVDKMKRDFWSRLESRLLDIYKNRSSVRYILTSSSDKKFLFSHFHKPEGEDEKE